jgi:NSS family neurotransmitter:Na+ symporter
MARPLQSIHGQWSSRWAFVLAATGSAVGLGNIWKFPYITGENGGGAFVLVYLACLVLIGLPVMMAEILVGRRGRQNPVNSLHSLAIEVKRLLMFLETFLVYSKGLLLTGLLLFITPLFLILSAF